MAEIQQLIFDILTRDRASESLSKIGRAADGAAKDTTVLTDKLKKLAEQSAEARVGLKGNKEAEASLDRLDAKLLTLSNRTANPNIKVEGAARALIEMSAVGAELDKIGSKDARTATSALTKLAGSGGIAGGGLGAAIAAGVVLSPVLVTLGTGLAGVAAAAYGVAKPIENAAKKTGGLQANLKMLDPEQRRVAVGILALGQNFQQFQNAMKPVILKDFNAGLSVAGHLLHDVQPVAQATGKALGGFLGQIDAEFQSKNWQNFFAFMARTAAPDMQKLGNLLTAVLGTIPPLAEALQPLASGLLTVATDAAKVAGQLANVGKASSHIASNVNQGAKSFDAQVVAWTNKYIPGAKQVNNALTGFQHAAQGGSDATKHLTPLQYANARAAAAQAAAISKLNAAMTANIAKVLTLEGDEVSWKQAQQAATQAVNQNHRALDGNSASALAARQAIIQSTSAVIKFADDSNTSTATLMRGSDALQNQIGWLEKHAGKSKIAREEIHLLREEEAKIQREIDQRLKVTGTGSYKVSFGANPVNNPLGKLGAATGWLVPGYGGGDRWPVLVEGGETIVPKHLTPAIAPLMKAHGVPGFATGGIIPSYKGGVPGLGPWAVHNTQATLRSLDQAVASATAHALRSVFSGLGGGPGGGAPSANAALARRLFPQWASGANWAAWNYVAMRESGWSNTANNASSGAYGIAQALPPTKYPLAGRPPWLGGSSNPTAQIGWMASYMASRYGGPLGAAAHERAFNWYSGGTGGAAPGWAVVGERGAELVRMRGGEDVIPAGATAAIMRGYAAGTDIGKGAQGRARDIKHAFRDATNSSMILRDMHRFLRLIANHFSGQEQRTRDSLVRSQAGRMADAANQLRLLRHDIAAAKSYQQNVRSNLSGYAAISSLDLTDSYGFNARGQATFISGAQSAATQLKGRLASLRAFAQVIKRLSRAGAPASIIRQVVSLGPDQGTPYGQELLADPAVMRQIAGLEKTIHRTEGAISRGAASAVYGGRYRPGANFLQGLTGERAHLEHLMRHLGRVLGEEAARWFRLPGRHRRRHHHLAAGGWLSSPVFGMDATGDTYSLAERGPEYVSPSRGGGRGGPLLVIEHLHVREAADIDLLARRLAFLDS